MRGPVLCVLWAWLSAAVLAAEPPISGPAEVRRDDIATLVVSLKADSKLRRVKTPAGLVVVKADDGKKWYVTGKPGVYTITGEMWTALRDEKGYLLDYDIQDIDYSIRVVGGPDPTPPGPDPGPNPPGPTPDASPIDEDGLNVLVVVDDGMLNLTREQLTTLDGLDFQGYLALTCPKDKTGRAAWRIYQKKTVPAADEDPRWAKAFARGQKELPWIVVGNKKVGGFEGPLPKTKADILATVKKYAGG